MNSRQIKLTGRRIGGTWGAPKKSSRIAANRGVRKHVNRGDFDDESSKESK
jgi:hypothetical protein